LSRQPNVVFVFSDQHRKEATGYAGNPDVKTPFLDALAEESLSFETAVCCMPVCCPYRASLLTGQYPLTHGVFMNDVPLSNRAVSIAEAFGQAGYDTAYIGKWHVDGRGRSNFIPRERRQGFGFWRAMECTHQYNESYYYGDEPVKQKWDGYDAWAQTRCARDYIRSHNRERPFFLVLSWGPPHNPYQTAPQQFKALYDPDTLTLRPNVPSGRAEKARHDLAGYYAHVSALDHCIGQLISTLRETGLEEDTIFVYTSDHGDMLYSHGLERKQRPWDESILVPFLLRYPAAFGRRGRKISAPINTPDIMPTLLGLCFAEIPDTVEGNDYSPYLRGEAKAPAEAALIECITPFGEADRRRGGQEYRGLRTERYTYVRNLQGPWLLYDNQADPYQMRNLCGTEEAAELQERLDSLLKSILQERGDEFLPGEAYIRRWGYVTDETGTVPFTW